MGNMEYTKKDEGPATQVITDYGVTILTSDKTFTIDSVVYTFNSPASFQVGSCAPLNTYKDSADIASVLKEIKCLLEKSEQ